jgi:CelD/BcsL family acetyltransferase involved in cellulose biosynthesis
VALTLEIVRDADALASWERPWWELAAAAPGATPFQTPGWLLPWWRRLGSGALAALLVRDEDRLRALAVFTSRTEDGTRRLRWAGAGISDYLTALVDPRATHPAWALLLRGLSSLLAEADAATLDNVPEGDPLFAALERLPPWWSWRRSADAVCLAAPLPPDARPRICLKAAAATRRLAREAPVTFTDLRGTDDDPDRRRALMEALFELHGQRWRARGGEGVMASEEIRQHHREASEALHRRGLLRLHALEHAGATVGVCYAFLFRARLWMYLCGYTPSLERFSPGSILVDRARASARAEGAMVMDFLRGEEAYKYRWGALPRATFRVDIARSP